MTMLRVAYCATLAVAVLSLNLHAIDARVLERALVQATLAGLVAFAVVATVPFTTLVTEWGEVPAIGVRAVTVGLIFMAGGMAAWNLIVAVRHL
jgi:hypothetical protein